MKHFKKQVAYLSVIALLLALLTTTIISCKDGGSDEVVNGGDTGVNQAILTRENVDDSLSFIEEKVPDCSVTSSVAKKVLSYVCVSLLSIPGCASSSTAERSLSSAGSFIEFTHGMNAKLVLSELSQWIRSATREIDPNETLVGSCGGEIGTDIIGNPFNGEFLGQVVFDNFCHEIGGEELQVNGSISISGKIDLETDELTHLSGSTDSGGIVVQLEDGSYTFVLEEAGISIEENRVTVTLESLILKEHIFDSVREYGIEDLQILITEGEVLTQLEGSGRFIRPDIGYVDFSITEPITMSDDGALVSGKVKITGANGTQMLITVLGDNQFQVQADTDGDGEFDYTPGILDCSGLNSEH